MARQKKEEKPVKIINVMADGTIIEDLTGHELPVTPETKMAYQIMFNVAMREARKQMQEQANT